MKAEQAAAILVGVMMGAEALANTVAITEFLTNPDGTDSGREYVELYNYGSAPVDLTDWRLTDQGTESFTFGAVTIAPDDYLVVVPGGSPTRPDFTPAQAKTVFEREWLGGTPDPRVIGANGYALGNGNHEIVLRDASGEVVWQVAYLNDDAEAVSTYLTGDDYSLTVWGDLQTPAVNRSGTDISVPERFPGDLGYQDHLGTEALIQSSDVAAIREATFALGLEKAINFFSGAVNASIGTPLGPSELLVVEASARAAVPALSLAALGAAAAAVVSVGAGALRRVRS